MKARIAHCKREKYDVYIGRPSKWGNPFSHKEDTLAEFRVSSRKEAIAKFEEYLISNKELLKDLSLVKREGPWMLVQA